MRGGGELRSKPVAKCKRPDVASQDSLCTYTLWTCNLGARWQFPCIIPVWTAIIMTDLASEVIVGGPNDGGRAVFISPHPCKCCRRNFENGDINRLPVL